MKIVMIGQKGIPVLFGGIERHVEEVSLRLAKKKNYKVFAYVRAYYTSKETKKYKSVNLIHMPSIKTKHLDAISHVFFSTIHSLFKIKPDIIHYHGIGPALCAWIPKVFYPQAKVIFTFHCRDYQHQKWGFFARFSLKLGEAIGCFFADEVIAVSPEIQEYILDTFKQRATYIPNGIGHDEYTPAKLIKKWGLEKNGYIFVVSRLIAHKGIQYLIKAYQQIKTDKKLVIVGPPFYTQGYEKKLKDIAGDNQNIMFLGGQHGKVMQELFSNAYLFVHPSEQEGLPIVVLEAASFGRPILLSDIKVHKFILKDLPFFFKNKNTNDLKEILDCLLKNPKITKGKTKELKKYVRHHYSWDKIVESLVLKYT